MPLPDIGMKDVLDWTVPIVLTWVGGGVRKYLREMRNQMREAKESVISLNLKISQLLERVDAHGIELDMHEKRIRHVEQKLPRK